MYILYFVKNHCDILALRNTFHFWSDTLVSWEVFATYNILYKSDRRFILQYESLVEGVQPEGCNISVYFCPTFFQI